MNPRMEVLGALFQGFSQACINLRFIAGDDAHNLLKEVSPDGWYALERFQQLEQIVAKAYDDPGPILERVGEEMMLGWYHMGPGKALVQRGVDFLSFQTGSEGFMSVIKGPQDAVGDFVLQSIDLRAGVAVVHSTTPFNRHMERGVLIGGMKAPGDLTYIDVTNDDDPNRFEISFW